MVLERVDLCGVPGGVDAGDGPCVDAVGGEFVEEFLQRPGFAGDGGGVRAVDGGHGEPVAEALEAGPQPLGGQGHGDHAALAGQGQPGLAAQGHDAGGVVEGDPAGDVGGGDLALGVADDGRGVHAQGAPGGGQRHHHREQHRLDHVDAGRGGGAGHLPQDVHHGPVEVGAQRLVALLHARAERGGAFQQSFGHGGPLGALPGEDEGDPVAGSGDATQHDGVRAVLGEAVEGVEEFLAVLADDRGPVLEAGARGHQGVARVGGVGVGVFDQSGAQQGGLGAQGGVVAGGEQQRDGDLRPPVTVVPDGGGGVGLRLRPGGLLEDDVGVGAADAEGGDGGAARGVPLGPGDVLGEQRDGARGPVDAGGGPVHVQGARQHPATQGEHHLDDAGDSGGGLGVAEVGLHGAEPQGVVGRAVRAVRGEEGLGLDGVAEFGAGAVGLDRVDVLRPQARVGQGLPDDPDLGGAAGGGQAVAGAVLVDGGAADDGEDGVAVAHGVGEPLHEQRAGAFAEDDAVGAGGEGPGAAGG